MIQLVTPSNNVKAIMFTLHGLLLHTINPIEFDEMDENPEVFANSMIFTEIFKQLRNSL